MENSEISTNVAKGIATAGKAVGKFIGNIPLIREGNVDEFLQDKGTNLQQKAIKKESKVIKNFASASNPETSVFIDKMDDIIQIYNHTSQIYIDKDNIYLLSD